MVFQKLRHVWILCYECPINLNTKSFTSYARALLMDKHHEKSTDYRNVRVDYKYN